MHNYLSVSKRPKYRKFFYQSNQAARIFTIRKLFLVWADYSLEKRHKRNLVHKQRLSVAF